ncbi:hypothetical protein K474DRAFT_1659199 [Panus rudis PR-1116 ss-1]|nr:hypothetical protein K474DRAFT_1659199 [Panus rudis PR-1116 ss-1]
MGRPLFSSRPALATASSAVRVEPEPTPTPYPTYETWTYWNAFDPDSDEFFEREDAVYEAFVDPSTLPQPNMEGGERDRSLSPVEASEESSSSSESESGRDTPVVDVENNGIYVRPPISRQTTTDSDASMDDVPQPPLVVRRTSTAMAGGQARSELTPRGNGANEREQDVNTASSVPVSGTPAAVLPVPIPQPVSRIYLDNVRPLGQSFTRAYQSPLPNTNARLSVIHISPPVVTPVPRLAV